MEELKAAEEENLHSKSIANSDEDEDKEEETLMSDVSIHEIEENFGEKTEANTVNEKRVEVKCIEFDWILNKKEGEDFLQRLSDTDNLAYFEFDIIKNIIMFQWSYFLPRIIMFLFMPFVAFFILFILYTTWLINKKNEETDSNGRWHRATLGVAIAILVFQAFHIYIEIHQLIFHKCGYFKSFWNMLDICSICLNITVVI